MAQVIVAQRMWQRRDTAAAWTSKNPVLAAGEIGIELGALPADTKFKIGDGSNGWNGLPYFGAGGNIMMRTSGGFIQWSNDGGLTWNNLISVADISGTDGREVEMRSSGFWLQWRYVGEAAWRDLYNLVGLKGDKGDRGDVGPAGPSSTTFPTASFDGGLGDIIVGSFCDLYVPFGFQINKVNLLGDAEQLFEVDIRVADFASFPPVSLNSICGATRPKLQGVDKYQDASLADWTREIPSQSTIRFFVTACTGVKRATLVLEGERI